MNAEDDTLDPVRQEGTREDIVLTEIAIIAGETDLTIDNLTDVETIATDPLVFD